MWQKKISNSQFIIRKTASCQQRRVHYSFLEQEVPLKSPNPNCQSTPRHGDILDDILSCVQDSPKLFQKTVPHVCHVFLL